MTKSSSSQSVPRRLAVAGDSARSHPSADRGRRWRSRSRRHQDAHLRSDKEKRQNRGEGSPDGRRCWRFSWGGFVITLIIITGLSLLMYPSAASWVNQYNQSSLIAGYEDEVANGAPPATEQLALAREYNKSLEFGASVEANHRLPTGFGYNSGTLDYNSLLMARPSGMMARLNIPAIDLDLPIYHGTSDATLLEGLGHLEGTSLPVGGAGTHSVITGHRGLANMTMFTNLDKVRIDDVFYIEVFGEILTYQVRQTTVVEPEQTESLRAQSGRDLVTLITCTPLGINTHRILVTAERIPTPEKPQISRTPEVPRFPWWIVIYCAGLTLAGIFMWRSGYPPKPRRSRGSRRSRTTQPRRALLDQGGSGDADVTGTPDAGSNEADESADRVDPAG